MTVVTTPVTQTVEVATRYAMDAGMRPRTNLRSGGPGRPIYRGSLQLVVDAPGRNSAFGAVYIGARSGRIVRGCITFGNNGPTRHYTGARAVLAALRALAALQTNLGCYCPACCGAVATVVVQGVGG